MDCGQKVYIGLIGIKIHELRQNICLTDSTLLGLLPGDLQEVALKAKNQIHFCPESNGPVFDVL
jgi:hypothetical protein